ncbi:MAG TPA: SDR family oxidoreductase [Deltaproteobacteria bacterium]|nr:SDR family oxidoreductase [Deltaproteobacteria bacterium]HQI80949.1 SDR family oxidoreductase [Deltaproteobacteria bacterium]
MAKKDTYRERTVYISGGSSGIGLACAKLFASLGADVFIFARRVEALQEAAALIEACRTHPGQRVAWTSLDVTDHDQVLSSLSRAIAEFGPPHVVIASAGLAYPDYFDRIPFAMFDQTVRTNLYGMWNVLRALIPSMKASGGHIVNVSSIAGFLGVFGYTAYSASKFAVIGLSEALRSEMKPHGIHVSVLCPPDTDTPGFARENLTKPLETKALGESAGLMSPDDVARAMLRGMERGRFLILPGMEGRFILAAKRLLPGVVNALMDRIVARARRAAGGR